jgi:hypothetical protein
MNRRARRTSRSSPLSRLLASGTTDVIDYVPDLAEERDLRDVTLVGHAAVKRTEVRAQVLAD